MMESPRIQAELARLTAPADTERAQLRARLARIVASGIVARQVRCRLQGRHALAENHETAAPARQGVLHVI